MKSAAKAETSAEAKLRRTLCVSLEPRPRVVDGVEILPYATFIEALWAGEFC